MCEMVSDKLLNGEPDRPRRAKLTTLLRQHRDDHLHAIEAQLRRELVHDDRRGLLLDIRPRDDRRVVGQLWAFRIMVCGLTATPQSHLAYE